MEILPHVRHSVTACVLLALAGLAACGGLLAYALAMETPEFHHSVEAYDGWLRAVIPVSFYLLAAGSGALLVFLSLILFRWWPGGQILWRVQAVLLAGSWGLFAAAVLLVLLSDVSTALAHYPALENPSETGTRPPGGLSRGADTEQTVTPRAR